MKPSLNKSSKFPSIPLSSNKSQMRDKIPQMGTLEWPDRCGVDHGKVGCSFWVDLNRIRSPASRFCKTSPQSDAFVPNDAEISDFNLS